MAEPALSVVATTAEPAVVDQIVLLPVDQIDDGDRLRPVDPVWAAALGRIMATDGQDEPISVCRLPGRPGWKLIAGGHRLAGARVEGWTEIRAVVKSADALDRRRREVSENLWRKGLDPLDRAAFVAELHEILRARAGIDASMTGRSLSAAVRWQKALQADADDATDMMSVAYGFTADVGEAIGLTGRTVRRDLELHRRLSPAVAALLRGHPVGRNAAQLRALTKLSEADQRRAADMILDGRAKGAGQAIKILQGGPRGALDQQDVYFNRAAALWVRLSAKSKRLVLSEIIARDAALPIDLRALLSGLNDEGDDATEVGAVLGQPDRGLVDAGRAAGRTAARRGGPREGRNGHAGTGEPGATSRSGGRGKASVGAASGNAHGPLADQRSAPASPEDGDE